MARLAREDQAEYAAVRRLCYSGFSSTQLRTAVTERLTQHLRADFAAFIAVDPATCVPVHAVHNEEIPNMCSTAWERALMRTPAFDYGAWVGHSRRAFLVDELAEAEGGKAGEDPYVRDVLLAFGLRHELQSHFVTGGRVWGGLHLSRRLGREGFEGRDVHLLDALAPHIAEGLRAAAARAALSAVPSTEVGVAVLGADGEVEVVNGVAEELLADGRAPETSPVRVVAKLLARDLTGRSVVPSVTVVDEARGRSYRVRGERAQGADGFPRGLIFIEPARPADSTDALRELGLTPRESEVAQAIIRGQSTGKIAASLVVSPYTVQDHVKNICNKLGVGSRRELAAVLLGVTAEPESGQG